ncbi:FAD-dependent oxidoreductase [Novosphingobium sp. KACC 22771]|uniref:FAD-dependent oxidoreductase n=1 Tax=Novosphingobium sp. KACC 22771 TaxID=3025670 RepID=UPI00236575FF|nr:NAD(P)-binding protein [Novosphingobium sp. KACC 22771]WDF73759.1 NAD(P)-binding protein [Novosphingobium sp. KACC 22771]
MRGEVRRRDLLAGAMVCGALGACGVLSGCGRAQGAPFPGDLLGPDMARGHAIRDGKLPGPTGAEERIPLVIAGGGVAGLAAGWRLAEAGFTDFALFELEDVAGGNARGGANGVTAFPWGAHYLPIPNREARALIHMLRGFGMITGRDAGGAPVYDPFQLCADLEERLLWRGKWQEGLVPTTGLSEQDAAQWRRFDAAMDAFRKAVGRDGRPAFASPSALSSRDETYAALDRISFGAWLETEGYTAAPLLAHLRYCARDDYGSEPEAISAWAGIHYFAGRRGWAADGAGESELTWPEGNARLARLMAGRIGPRLRPRHSVTHVARYGEEVLVDVFDHQAGVARRIRAQAVVLAMPDFVARHVAPGLAAASRFSYAPWVVANVAVSRMPWGPGVPLAWDNVSSTSASLGYVVANHQTSSAADGPGVLTWYQALSDGDPVAARKGLLARGLGEWQVMIAADLLAMNPELDGRIERIDVWRWGHAMVRPTVGFRSDPARIAAQAMNGPVFRAHSDLSGLSLFEEAHYHGVLAAERALAHLGRGGESLL